MPGKFINVRKVKLFVCFNWLKIRDLDFSGIFRVAKIRWEGSFSNRGANRRSFWRVRKLRCDGDF